LTEPNPLTIAQIDSEMGFSGGEVQVFLLLEGLRSLGHRSLVFCQPGSRCAEECVRRGFKTRLVRMRNDLDVPAVLRLQRGFRECGADLVHANTGRDTWLAGLAAWWAGLPAVTTRRMDRHVRRGLRTKFIYTRLFRRVGAISPGVAECLREGGVPDSRILVIPEAADPRRTTPSTDRAVVREALGVRADEILVLGLGALIRRKGFDILLEALARLDRSISSGVQVRIAGSGEEQIALEKQAAALGLEARVRLLGRREDVADLLGACDVFVLPSRREGLGVASLEAMGAGRPVIASRVGGLGFVVRDGETGLLVPPEDVEALAGAMRRILTDAELRDRLGAGGRARVTEHFTPERMVESYVRLYGEILAEHAADRRKEVSRRE